MPEPNEFAMRLTTDPMDLAPRLSLGSGPKTVLKVAITLLCTRLFLFVFSMKQYKALSASLSRSVWSN